MWHGVPVDRFAAVASGFSSTVYRRSDGSCAHVPRNADAAQRLRYADRVASVLSSETDGFELPLSEAWVAPSDRWPYGASVTTWIIGSHVSAETDPRSVARFLATLHAIDPQRVSPPIEDFDAWTLRQLHRARTGLRDVEDLIERQVLSRAAKALTSLQENLRHLPKRSVVHGDFWHENLVQREGELIGVLDWEECGIGDPAIDLAGLWYLGEEWAQEVIAVLSPSEAEIARCIEWRVARELEGAAWSRDYADEPERRESADKLTKLISKITHLDSPH